MYNFYNENIDSPNKINRKKIKNTNNYIKNEFNTFHATRSYSSNNNRNHENIIRSSRFGEKEVNDEIYSNEFFEIILKEEDDELMSKNIKSVIKNLSSKLLEYNQIKQEKINNKFKNLKISSKSIIEIKSTYDNLNVFTNYRYIMDKNLRRKTKQFLGLQCGFLSQFSLSNYKNCISPKKRTDSKPKKKMLKISKSRKSLDSPKFPIKNYRCLSYYKSDLNSPIRPNENILKKRSKSKNLDTIIRKAGSFCLEKRISKSLVTIRQTSSIKSKDYSRRSYMKKSISYSSEGSPKKKNRRKKRLSSDLLMKKKTRRKMDLISENMQKDRKNLNNPSEFYADLFSSFVVNQPQISGTRISGLPALPTIKVSRYEEN